MKNRLQTIVARILSVSIAKTYSPLGHKIYGTFDHYVARAQDICIK